MSSYEGGGLGIHEGLGSGDGLSESLGGGGDRLSGDGLSGHESGGLSESLGGGDGLRRDKGGGLSEGLGGGDGLSGHESGGLGIHEGLSGCKRSCLHESLSHRLSNDGLRGCLLSGDKGGRLLLHKALGLGKWSDNRSGGYRHKGLSTLRQYSDGRLVLDNRRTEGLRTT